MTCICAWHKVGAVWERLTGWRCPRHDPEPRGDGIRETVIWPPGWPR